MNETTPRAITLTEQHCPLCGGNNQCAIATNKEATDCWCRHATISQKTLAQLPDDKQSRSCICPKCAAITDRLARPAN